MSMSCLDQDEVDLFVVQTYLMAGELLAVKDQQGSPDVGNNPEARG